MGKKKTPEEKAIRARENGFNDSGDDIDDSFVLKEVLPYTDRVYNGQMDMWREFAKIRLGVNPSHFRTLKHFAEFVGLLIRGQLEEIATVDISKFDYKASRVRFSAKMNFYCYSSARIGELTESLARVNSGKGLRYRDIVMLVG
ncbi:hypothetical protein G7Y89_g4408 [Cudoniella acicularis]|uniref:Uncharacterized protein n=1 Tax=Cudoniella acicularis TaxID=354080 RepID=A0A8H4RPI5_9HELO|nr:hypothetical protein G7Y89_g4408 [Cudoniella acicularis]